MHRKKGLYIAAATALLVGGGCYSLGAGLHQDDAAAAKALEQIAMVRLSPEQKQLETIDAIINEYRLTHAVQTMAKNGI